MTTSSSTTSHDISVALRRVSWSWLAALARHLELGFDVVDDRGGFCALAGSGVAAPWPQRRLSAVAHDAALQAAIRSALESGRLTRLALEGLDLALAPVHVAQRPAVFVVARDAQHRTAALDLDAFTTSLASALEAHLPQAADDDAFDRVASLHRLLHESVENGNERDVVMAFAEAVFAWDGIETSGYVYDIEGALTRLAAAPGARRGNESVALPAPLTLTTLAPLSPELASQFGFDEPGRLLAIELRGTTLEPWVLVFAEGFSPLNESRASLYVDLLREALGRAAAIAGTRLAWAVLQPLLGAGEPEAASTASLTELARALPAHGATLVVTASNGAVVLNVGDDEQSAVRPFGRVNRLVASARAADGYVLNLTVRRQAGEPFTRREEQVLDRTVAVFATWLSRLLEQGTLLRERRAERREFDLVLDRAATQALRDGADISMLLISAPELASRSALLKGWVTELRGRLRGSDLAGAVSDTEIGVLLCGVTVDTVDAVSARLCKHLKFGDRGNPVAALGATSVVAGQSVEGSLVQAARRAVASRALNEKGGRR